MASSLEIIDVMSSGAVAAIRIAGRLDARSAQELMRHCQGLLERGHRHLLINLSGITFVASSGIGTVLALTEDLKEQGGGLRLIEPSQAFASVVEILNLGQFLSINSSEDEAMAAIGA